MSAHAQNLTVNCAYSTLMCCMHVLYLISLSITRERGLNCRLSFKKHSMGIFISHSYQDKYQIIICPCTQDVSTE